MISARTLPRAFEINGTIIDCIMPHAPLEDAVKELAKHNPQFHFANISEEKGQVLGNKLVFKLEFPPPKTKG
jgi:hypothetical protein